MKPFFDTTSPVAIPFGQANFPAPFASGLEYSSPARGTWNIVHVGMMIPQAHQIFVCAQGCLRGVVLTAAEMGAIDRFSTIAVRENNVLDGDMEWLIIDGVSDIIEKLPQKPPAFLIYTSCIHHFMGCDLDLVYRTLRSKYPDIAFTDCYMNPIMRKSGLNPDQTMRRQLYSLLQPLSNDDRTIHIAGSDFPLYREDDFCTLLTENGYRIVQIPECKTYDEYLRLAEAGHCITTFPAAIPAGNYLQENFGQKHLHLPVSFDFDEILDTYRKVGETFGFDLPDFSEKISACEKALREAKVEIGDTPITVDYTVSPRPLSLVRMLLRFGFSVTRVYADSFTGEEKEDFAWLKTNAPEIEILPTVHSHMRVEPRNCKDLTLAIGQKAAYFTGTDRFVNIVEGGGMYGFDGILRMTQLMVEAFRQPKDTRSLVQIKGMGCHCGL